MNEGSATSTRTWNSASIVPDSAKKNDTLFPVQEEPLIIIPTASQEAIDFLVNLEAKIEPKLCFKDDLVSTTNSGESVGTFKVSVEPMFRSTEDVYCVHASSTGEIDRVPCGTTVIAYVSKTLQTLEQHHSEYIKIEGHSIDRKTFLQQEVDGSYTVKRTLSRGNAPPKEFIQSYSAESMRGFLSEGSNILLQRMMVLAKIENVNQMTFLSFDAECNLCQCSYGELDELDVEIEDQLVRVGGIERKIWPHQYTRPEVPVVDPPQLSPDVDTEQEAAKLPATWQSFYLASGHLATRLQIGSPISMTILRLPLKPIEDDLPPKPVVEKKDLNYEEDVELNSIFNQRKSEYKSSHMTYLSSHPEFKCLLSDFVQHILLRKPNDVVGAAQQYFLSFSLHEDDSNAYSNAAEFRKDLSMIKEDLRDFAL